VTTVTVQPLPVPLITSVEALPICPEFPVTLDAGPGYATYDWSNGDSTQATTVLPGGPATFSVLVTDGYGCQGAADFDVLTRPPEPDIDISLTELDFVVNRPGDVAGGTVIVSNANCGTLRTRASLTLGPPFSILENTCQDMDIGPLDSCQISVGFAPYVSRRFEAELVLQSENDPDEPEVRILLRGLGINVGIPTLSGPGLALLSLVLAGIAWRRLRMWRYRQPCN
jgi:hypothetical protein